MTLTGDQFRYAKPVVLLAACVGLMRADVIQTLSIDLSALHPGSVLAGSVVLQNPLVLGDSAVIPLSFSDPSNYNPTSFAATLSVTSGVPEDQFRFSGVSFTDLANNKMYNLTVVGAARCAVDFPCDATGGFEANSPPAFSGTYAVTSAAAPAAVPEPGSGLLVACMATCFAFRRRLFGVKPTA